MYASMHNVSCTKLIKDKVLLSNLTSFHLILRNLLCMTQIVIINIFPKLVERHVQDMFAQVLSIIAGNGSFWCKVATTKLILLTAHNSKS